MLLAQWELHDKRIKMTVFSDRAGFELEFSASETDALNRSRLDPAARVATTLHTECIKFTLPSINQKPAFPIN